MRILSAVMLALCVPAAAVAQTPRELLDAIEKQLKAVHDTAGPGLACVVVSRSEHYPKPAKPPAHAGQLGDFDRAAFLKGAPAKSALADHLDLSPPRNATNHTTAGGVVIDESGLVLTNYQSIDGATKIYVHLAGGKGSYADVHAADSRSDLAVVKLLVPPPGLKTVKVGEVRFADTPDGRRSTVQPGKLVVALTLPASPNFALDRPSGTLGALGDAPKKQYDAHRDATPRHVYEYGTLLALDAKLNLGISGAGVFNLDGELIGLTTQTVAPTGDNVPGYALPMDANTRRIVEVLRRGEEVEYGYLGVRLSRRGIFTSLVLERVTPQSPAAEAGLIDHDELVRINGVPVSDYADLLFQAGCALAGSKLKLTVRRGGRLFDTEMVLGKFPADHPFLATVRPEPVFGLRVDYGTVLAFRVSMNNWRVDASGVPPGVCVRELVPGSPAEKQFKALGELPTRWLITHANGVPVTSPAEFHAATTGKPGVKLTLLDPTDVNPRPRDLTIP